MRVIDPGHQYYADALDQPTDVLGHYIQHIQFVKREGANYPGNVGTYPGTNCQELLRVLIHRVQYLHKQKPHWGNAAIIYHLRFALFLFERRAASLHKRKIPAWGKIQSTIETLSTCDKCGHISCGGMCQKPK